LEFASHCFDGLHEFIVPLTLYNFKKGRCDSSAA
jgi:hypothetical protein